MKLLYIALSDFIVCIVRLRTYRTDCVPSSQLNLGVDNDNFSPRCDDAFVWTALSSFLAPAI